MKSTPRLIVWGTYDTGKPRVRILIRGLREVGVEVTECHAEVWAGIDDKSQLRSLSGRLTRAGRWLAAYPQLLSCLLGAPRRQILLVPYLGHLDVLLLWPLARLRGHWVIWDAFLSLYNTVVEDRVLVSRRHPLAIALYALEWLATRAADRVVLDTDAHADYFARRFRLPRSKLASVLVGAEQEQFPLAPPLAQKGLEQPIQVLFYGQFIPLHGIPTIVRAAQHLDDGSVHWVLIGRGQEASAIRTLLARNPVRHLTWIPWVDYDALSQHIAAADCCLGIFGASEKAAQVIPNKVFQVISAGRPLITRRSPAIAELAGEATDGLYLVPPEDPLAIVGALAAFRRDRSRLTRRTLYPDLRARISTIGVGNAFCARLLGGDKGFA